MLCLGVQAILCSEASRQPQECAGVPASRAHCRTHQRLHIVTATGLVVPPPAETVFTALHTGRGDGRAVAVNVRGARVARCSVPSWRQLAS